MRYRHDFGLKRFEPTDFVRLNWPVGAAKQVDSCAGVSAVGGRMLPSHVFMASLHDTLRAPALYKQRLLTKHEHSPHATRITIVMACHDTPWSELGPPCKDVVCRPAVVVPCIHIHKVHTIWNNVGSLHGCSTSTDGCEPMHIRYHKKDSLIAGQP